MSLVELQLITSFVLSVYKSYVFSEPHQFVHPDVLAVTEELIDDIVFGTKYGKKKRRRVRRMENAFKRGWWTIDRLVQKEGGEVEEGRGWEDR